MEDSPLSPERSVLQIITTPNAPLNNQHLNHSPKNRYNLDPPQILEFLCENNKKVINMMIRGKPELIDEALGRVVVGKGKVLDFDVKKIYFRKEVKKIKEGLRDRQMPISNLPFFEL